MVASTVLVTDQRHSGPSEGARLAAELLALTRATVVLALPAAPRAVKQGSEKRTDYVWWGREPRPARFNWSRQSK